MIKRISDDSFLVILSFFTPKQLTNMLMVNKYFFTWCSTCILSLKQENELFLSNDTFQMLFDSCAKNKVTRLELNHLDSADILANARCLPNLSEISMSGRFHIGEAVMQLEPLLHQVSQFNIKLAQHKHKIIDNEAFLQLFKGLTDSTNIHHVSLDNCYCFLSQNYDYKILSRLNSLEIKNESLERSLIYTDYHKNILRVAPNLTHLSISYSGVFVYGNEFKSLIEQCCKNLKSLSLHNCAIAISMNEDENELTNTNELFPNLEKLSLNTSLMVDEAFFISDPDWHPVLGKLKHLEWIELPAGKNMENNILRPDFFEILKHCTDLRTLRINRIEDNRFVSECFDFLLNETFDRCYKKVDLSETSIDARALVNIIRYGPHLRELTARASFAMHHIQARMAEGMNFGNEFLTEDDLASRVMFHSIASKLRVLDLSNCIISDYFFMFIMSASGNLERLILNGTMRKSHTKLDYNPYSSDLKLPKLHTILANECDSSMAVLILSQMNTLNVKSLQRLEMRDIMRVATTFHVSDFADMTKEMLQLLERSSKLHTLKVNGMTTFDDACIDELVQNGAPLTVLHVSDTSCTLETLSKLNLENISSLEFVSCAPISSIDLLHTVLLRLKQLNKLHIDIGGCGMVSDSWKVLGNSCKHLRKLKIVGKLQSQQNVDEKVFMHTMLKQLRSLKYIYLDFCPLSIQNLASVEEELRKLRFKPHWRIPYEEDSTEESSWNCNVQ